MDVEFRSHRKIWQQVIGAVNVPVLTRSIAFILRSGREEARVAKKFARAGNTAFIFAMSGGPQV
jgi:hypothetical protein